MTSLNLMPSKLFCMEALGFGANYHSEQAFQIEAVGFDARCHCIQVHIIWHHVSLNWITFEVTPFECMQGSTECKLIWMEAIEMDARCHSMQYYMRWGYSIWCQRLFNLMPSATVCSHLKSIHFSWCRVPLNASPFEWKLLELIQSLSECKPLAVGFDARCF